MEKDPIMGIDRSSNEYIFAEGNEVHRARTLQRCPRAEQWN